MEPSERNNTVDDGNHKEHKEEKNDDDREAAADKAEIQIDGIDEQVNGEDESLQHANGEERVDQAAAAEEIAAVGLLHGGEDGGNIITVAALFAEKLGAVGGDAKILVEAQTGNAAERADGADTGITGGAGEILGHGALGETGGLGCGGLGQPAGTEPEAEEIADGGKIIQLGGIMGRNMPTKAGILREDGGRRFLSASPPAAFSRTSYKRCYYPGYPGNNYDTS